MSKKTSDGLFSRDLITAVVKYFGQALLFGNKFIYQAMPRLLSLWLDFGATVIEAEHKEKKEKNADKNKLQLQKLQVQKNILSKINAVGALSALSIIIMLIWILIEVKVGCWNEFWKLLV